MKYLLIGNKGQLGRAFGKKFKSRNIDFTGVDIDTLDIFDARATAKLVKSYCPDIIINCAAYNDVDRAEADPMAAYRTNAMGVLNLAKICDIEKIKLVHYSSDYIFDGNKRSLYSESDKTNPINEYGKSKLSGEKFLTTEIDNFLIFRLSWVFGEGMQNFIYKFKNWAAKSDTLEIAENEVSVPTYTETVADVTLKAIEQGLQGLYHLTSSGYASRFDYAKYICEILNLNNKLIPVPKEKFKLPARRPDFSAMDNSPIARKLNIYIPNWKEEVERFLISQ